MLVFIAKENKHEQGWVDGKTEFLSVNHNFLMLNEENQEL